MDISCRHRLLLGFHAICATIVGSCASLLLILLLFFALGDIAFRVASAVYYAVIFFALALIVVSLDEGQSFRWSLQLTVSVLLALSGTLCLGLNQILVLCLDASWGPRLFLRTLLNAALAFSLTAMVIFAVGSLVIVLRRKTNARTPLRGPHLWWMVGTPLFIGTVTGGMFGVYEDAKVVSAGASIIPHRQELFTAFRIAFCLEVYRMKINRITRCLDWSEWNDFG
eukprot:GEMP01055728.1.p1 GENE.GEMP01055728.1~~GEMP01055728.1.p1  ORF type:complete len:226 (+),score=26.46 GEMP01055728.1:57-734(+)